MDYRSPLVCLRAASFLLLLAATARAQVTVTVDAAQTVRTVDNRHFGVNSVMWDPQTASAQTITLAQAADLRFIRIPGGSLSDTYDWSRNKSYASAGVLNSWGWSAGMDKFVQLIGGANAQAMVTVNYGSGTPEMAAAWVAYCNASSTLLGTGSDVTLGVDSAGNDWKTAGYWSALRAAAPLGTDDGRNFLRLNRAAPLAYKYWEVGNECYGSWENDYHAARWDPVTYANSARDIMVKMRSIDPTIKIGVVCEVGEDTLDSQSPVHNVTNPRTSVSHKGWTPVLLTTLKGLGATAVPDFLIYHRYEQSPGNESDTKLLMAPENGISGNTSGGWASDAANLRSQLNDYLGTTTAAGIELTITENNSVFSDPGKQSTSLVNGLFYADSLASVLQTEFNVYMWWALRNGSPTSNGALAGNMSAALYGWRNYGDYGVISTPSSPVPGGATDYVTGHPVYYMMKLLSHFARGGDTVVRATSTNTLLSAYAAKRQDGTLSLLVINKSPTADTTATIALTGFTPRAVATTYSYGISQDEAAHTGGSDAARDIATASISNAAGSFSMSFPRYSATVISFATPAPTILIQPQPIATATGANVVFSVLASGTGTITYQWQKDGTPISGATSTSLSLTNVNGSIAGTYGVAVRDGTNVTVISTLVPLTVSGQAYVAPASILSNISTRAMVGVGDNIMIGGFVINGSGSKKVLIRAVGPALAQYGVPGVLADPTLELTTLAGATLATNNDWESDNATAIAAGPGTAFAHGSKDAALIVTLPVGQYTALVRGAGSTTGIAQVQLYDLDQTAAARLVNLSTRALVGTDAGIMIAGFQVSGAGNRNVLVRALGPTLSQWLSGFAPDPQLALKTLSNTTLASNDNWDSTNATAIAAAAASTGAYPLAAGTKDAALLASLPDGQYTPWFTERNGVTGIGLVEVYEAP